MVNSSLGMSRGGGTCSVTTSWMEPVGGGMIHCSQDELCKDGQGGEHSMASIHNEEGGAKYGPIHVQVSLYGWFGVEPILLH